MQDFDIPEEVGLLSKAVWHLAGSEGIEALAALAWLIRNRQKWAERHQSQYGCVHPRYGDGSLRTAIRSVLEEEGVVTGEAPCGIVPPRDEAYCRALATVWPVWSGETPDPTSGATRYHHHGKTPFWSRDRAPSALIGERLYYSAAWNSSLVGQL